MNRPFSIFGFPLHIDVSALFVLALIVLPRAQAGGASGLAFALVYAVIVFGSILVHELGHAFVARAYRLGAIDITLHGFGGLTRYTRVAPAGRAFWVTLAGPGAGFLLGFVMLALALVLPGNLRLFAAMAAEINLFWSAFNLLPMLPLDGGSLVVHGLTRRVGPHAALRWAARVSLFVAVPLGVYAYYSSSIFLGIVVLMALFRAVPLAFADR